MNTLVSISMATATPVAAPAMPSQGRDRRALEAYASWLHMERRILCGELWPHMGADAEKLVWGDNAGYDWHFSGRGDLAWNEGPQPSSRAQAALDLVGVDWRKPKEDLGLNHCDTGSRPPLPQGWPNQDPVIDLAQSAISAYEAHEACLGDLVAPERAMTEWEKRNPKPKWDHNAGRCGINGNVEYERWFKRWAEAETDDEREALRAIDPNRELKEALAQLEIDIPKWEERKLRAEQYCGLTAARANESRRYAEFTDLMKQLRQTCPTSLRGIFAKAKAAYETEIDINNHFALVRDLVSLSSQTAMGRLPDLILT